MNYENILVGADPELFLCDAAGKLRSAIGLIGGTKWEPRKLDDKGSAVQEDNVAVEFNIPPASSRAEFLHSIGSMLEYINNYVEGKGLSLNIIPAGQFDADQLADPKALEFGCDPDYNVWLRRENAKPNLPDELMNLRSCGGHVHVSWTDPGMTGNIEEVKESQEDVIMAMDVFLGCPSIQYDSDLMRRKLYGKAGAFRPKVYGIEYRTLSNFWLREPSLVEWVYDQTIHAMDYLNSGGKIDREHSTLINTCINTGDESLFHKIQQLYPV